MVVLKGNFENSEYGLVGNFLLLFNVTAYSAYMVFQKNLLSNFLFFFSFWIHQNFCQINKSINRKISSYHCYSMDLRFWSISFISLYYRKFFNKRYKWFYFKLVLSCKKLDCNLLYSIHIFSFLFCCHFMGYSKNFPIISNSILAFSSHIYNHFCNHLLRIHNFIKWCFRRIISSWWSFFGSWRKFLSREKTSGKSITSFRSW